jgi:hypothetical protein
VKGVRPHAAKGNSDPVPKREGADPQRLTLQSFRTGVDGHLPNGVDESLVGQPVLVDEGRHQLILHSARALPPGKFIARQGSRAAAPGGREREPLGRDGQDRLGDRRQRIVPGMVGDRLPISTIRCICI